MPLKTSHDLLIAVAKLTPIQTHILAEMAESMIGSFSEVIEQGSDLLAPEFVDHFVNRLRMHHATHYERFNKKAFEYAFHASALYAGKKSSIVNDPTNPGADVIVDGVPFSLKTEAAAGIHDGQITISKLMEARWIRECLSLEDFARETTKRVVAHLQKYSRIIMLRSFSLSPTLVRYKLIEIPVKLLLMTGDLKPGDFKERTQNGSSSAAVYLNIPGEHLKAFSVRLDGSVEKVTISGLLSSLCILHGTWEIKTVPPE